ncbi:MAG: hypothetical protein DMF59_01915 [Acidobacteria bacterium]|nr:MAG: hypothetical protein DMF59_01915 [Acidobacteriota bacterium]
MILRPRFAVLLFVASTVAAAYLPPRHIEAIAADPSNPNTLYVATGSAGVFKSTDAGAHWRRLPIPVGRIGSLAMDPKHATTIFAGTWEGLYRSTNGGAEWKKLDESDSSPVVNIAIAPKQPSSIYAARISGISHSSDSGEHWQRVFTEPGFSNISSVVVDPLDPKLVFAGFLNFDKRPNLYRSTDGGAKWKALSDVGAIDSLVADHSGRIYAATRSGIMRTSDHGESWQPFAASLRNANAVAFFGKTIYVARYGDRVDQMPGVYKSGDDGKSWTEVYSFRGGVQNLIRTPAGLYVVLEDRLFGSTDEREFRRIGREITEAVRTVPLQPL